MNIHVITYVYGLAETTMRCFESVNAPNVTWHCFMHSDNDEAVAACEALDQHDNVIVYPYGTNRGLAASCNEGIINAQSLGADVVMQVCDDIIAGAGDIQRLAHTVMANPSCSFVSGRTYVEKVHRWEAGSFDVCAINLRAVEAIGYFDRNCWPVNFEDVDWKRRALLAGFTPLLLGDTTFTHCYVPSGYEDAGRMHRFYATRDYYVSKWGGDQNEERYVVPFNDARYDLRIARENIDNPYPEYARAEVMR